jgi:uncharacterized protein with PIN domain
MNRIISIVLIFLCGCGGSLTEEQRHKAKKDMEDHAIKKISEAQITEAAFAMGRKQTAILEIKSMKKSIIDSLENQYKVKIVVLSSTEKSIGTKEKEVLEAYQMGSGKADLTDNIQKIGLDTILYTKPIMKELPDGSLQFSYAIGIKMPKREVVLSIK